MERIVGRDDELAQLRAALVAACAGAGRLVLVSGEPGIGKSSLTARLADMAGDYGVPAVTGRAVDDPGMPPLWPWQEVGRSVPPLADALRDPAGAAGEALATADSGAASGGARFAMFRSACQALAGAAAERGLVVVLEDLQWADRTSLLLLGHLASEAGRGRLLLAATFREAADQSLGGLLPTLLRAEGTRLIRLTGLARPAIAQWLRRAGTDGDVDRLAGRLQARTGGNPLFVRMLVERGAVASDDLGGFPELRQLVLARLGGLDAQARELIDVASVLGERVEPGLVSEVARLGQADVGAGLDRATALGVLAADPGLAELRFAHALVRDAVYAGLAPSRRMALHERAAGALERAGGGAGLAGQVASHWQRSGQPGWAAHCVRWARAASRDAAASLAYDEAARFAGLALRAAEADNAQSAAGRAELTLDAARAEYLAGHIETSLAHCQAAARQAGDAGRPDILAAAALVITGVGDPPVTAAVDALCARALDAVPPADTAVRARLRARQAIFAAEAGACNRARDLSAEALALAERGDDPDALLDGIHARHLSLCAPQFLAERRELAIRACQVARGAHQPLAELWGHVWLVDAAFQAGDLAAVDEQLGRIEQLAAARKHTLAWWHLHRLRATRAALVGELAAAAEHNEAARAIAAQFGDVSTTGMYYVFLNQLALLRGTMDQETAEAILATLRLAPGVPMARVFAPIVHALRGDRDLALATFEEFRYLPGAFEVGPRWAPLLMHIGIGAVLIDDAETAGRVLRELGGLAPGFMGDGSGAAFCGGSTERIVGDLALCAGQTHEAVRRYTAAIEMNARAGARPFLALSRLGLGRALLARGDLTDLPAARALVTRAAAEFRRLGLPGQLAAADTLLARVDSAAVAASPLSPRESEVATLIAQALSNRQIAGQLVLSERTVETHVRSILAKLGYSTRTEIATWALRNA